MSEKISVLICTYNRPQRLAQCLRALVDNTSAKPDQVVIVNGGDERADQVVESIQSYAPTSLEIKVIKTINKNLAASRNVGLPQCTGDIIAMTDDDAEVFPDWILQVRRAHGEHPEAGAVGGAVFGTDTTSLLGKLSDLVTFPRWNESRYVRTLPGVNIAYKRHVVEQVGLQDEALFRGEDVDYNWRVQQLGYKVYFDPAIRVHHHHRLTLRGFLSQHYMYGRAYYLVRRKWTEMYCIYPHALRRPKDFLKALNFVLALFYEPVRYAFRLQHPIDTLRALPVLFLNSLGWRSGMVYQKLITDHARD